jgi:hypothetical protein
MPLGMPGLPGMPQVHGNAFVDPATLGNDPDALFERLSFGLEQSFEDAVQAALKELPSAPASAHGSWDGTRLGGAVSVSASGPVGGVFARVSGSEPSGAADVSGVHALLNPVHSGRETGTARWRALIEGAAARHGVPARLVENVLRTESGGDARATSSAGAMGLMQLMPGTARELGVTDPYDPVQNLDGGVRYLAQLLRRFEGNLEKAVAAYNAGPGAVQKFNGVPPYAETQRYVDKVLDGLDTKV